MVILQATLLVRKTRGVTSIEYPDLLALERNISISLHEFSPTAFLL